jgi:ketosteroid isomerase-like protein
MTKETTKQTEATLAHHMQSLGGGLLEAVLSDYTEDSVIFTASGMVNGLAKIRAFFDSSIKNTPPAVWAAFTMIRQDIEGEVAYILWKAEPFIALATDTFVVRNGKIQAQTFTAFTPS